MIARMGRHKTRDKHLPALVSLEAGTYYFRRGKEPRVNLGRDFADAMRRYGELLGERPFATFGNVCDKYIQSIEFTTRGKRTRTDYLRYLVPIRAVFGAV